MELVYTTSMRSKKWKRVWETTGTVFLDLGKLSFGSLILGSILKGEIDQFQIFVFGIAAAALLFVAGIWFIFMSED
ncbi:hypothetical protein AGMMS50293_00130 [Spirochaetia bacterium]|nr:hypothetical protein AGMMS50293_00130 [Spirochaetia bacterium]